MANPGLSTVFTRAPSHLMLKSVQRRARDFHYCENATAVARGVKSFLDIFWKARVLLALSFLEGSSHPGTPLSCSWDTRCVDAPWRTHRSAEVAILGAVTVGRLLLGQTSHTLFVLCCGERGSARSLPQGWSLFLVLQQTQRSPNCANPNLRTLMLSQNTEQKRTKFPNPIHRIPYLGWLFT